MSDRVSMDMKGVVKAEHRKAIDSILNYNYEDGALPEVSIPWFNTGVEFMMKFSTNYSADFIMVGCIYDDKNTSWNIETGELTFSGRFVDNNTVKELFEILPLIFESIELLLLEYDIFYGIGEYYLEDDMIKTRKDFNYNEN